MFLTATPLECETAVVPSAPRVGQVSVLDVSVVQWMISDSISMITGAAKPVPELSTIEVTELLIEPLSVVGVALLFVATKRSESVAAAPGKAAVLGFWAAARTASVIIKNRVFIVVGAFMIYLAVKTAPPIGTSKLSAGAMVTG